MQMSLPLASSPYRPLVSSIVSSPQVDNEDVALDNGAESGTDPSISEESDEANPAGGEVCAGGLLQQLLLRSAGVSTATPTATNSVKVLQADVVVDTLRDAGLYPYQSLIREIMRAGWLANILVASPTGSGKSFVIYEAAHCARQLGGTVYVGEPLIALVEQVYAACRGRGFATAMRTGPSSRGEEGRDATVVVCTYEVLAKMGNERGLPGAVCVVIDEVHFLAVPDRGPVIQEILQTARVMSLPIFALSGTIPNSISVARFLSACNALPTKVVGALRRPIELKHYYYDATSTKRAQGDGFGFSLLRPASSGRVPALDDKFLGGVHTKQDLLLLIRGLAHWDCLPALLVAFKCSLLETFAQYCAGEDLLDRKQKSVVSLACRRMLKLIPEEDRVLFDWLVALLSRGIALHQSQLPTQYLELVCLLAAKRCVKLVFSTSTLSAGIDLPVRTVVLLGYRIPRRQRSGGVLFETIDPLLLNQLCGRAGRPGLETEGNVVFTGKGWAGYTSAQALMLLPLPPVIPTTEFSVGDVLRSIRSHRSLVLDRLVFEDASVQALALAAEESGAIAEEAIDFMRGRCTDGTLFSMERCQAAAQAVEALSCAPAAALAHCAVEGDRHIVLRDRDRLGFVVVTSAPTEASLSAGKRADSFEVVLQRGGATQARQTQRRKKGLTLPLHLVGETVRAKAAAKALLEANLDETEQAFASVLRNVESTVRALRLSPSFEAYDDIARELAAAGCVTVGALTLKGRAAAEIRTCPDPVLLVDLLTRGSFGAAEYVELASLAVGSGSPDDARTGRLAPEVEDELRRRVTPSAVAFNQATAAWVSGLRLADVLLASQTLSVGGFCRHLTRVHDCLVDMSGAYDVLGVPEPAALLDAKASVARPFSLPFLRRGVGRVQLDQWDVEGEVDELETP
jgi:hypothetical protein